MVKRNIGNSGSPLYQSRYFQALRAEVIQAYGGKCRICLGSESLEFDHVNNNGNVWRRETKIAGRQFLLWLKEHNFPKDIQLLCEECHKYKKRILSFGYENHIDSSTNKPYYVKKSYSSGACFQKPSGRARFRRARFEAVSHYGGACYFCGLKSEELSISSQEVPISVLKKRIHISGNYLYYWLRKQNYPKGFAPICQNCYRNRLRFLTFGY